MTDKPVEQCPHERLDEDGICRNCGGDERGIGHDAVSVPQPQPVSSHEAWCAGIGGGLCTCDPPQSDTPELDAADEIAMALMHAGYIKQGPFRAEVIEVIRPYLKGTTNCEPAVKFTPRMDELLDKLVSQGKDDQPTSLSAEQLAKKFEESWIDTSETMVTFKDGTIWLPLYVDGKWVDRPLWEILAAYSAHQSRKLSKTRPHDEWRAEKMMEFRGRMIAAESDSAALREQLATAQQEIKELREGRDWWKADALSLVVHLRAKCSDEEWKKLGGMFKSKNAALQPVTKEEV